MEGVLGNYSRIAAIVNIGNTTEIKITPRQIEKTITRHPSYEPKISLPETQLFNFTKDTFSNYTVTRETIIPETMKRRDVFIKEIKVGLEFNGDYWHSNEVIKHNYGVFSDEFHTLRTKEAQKTGIKICYIWESDWNNNYFEIEKLIFNEKWDSHLLNKTTNENEFKRVIPPKANALNSLTQVRRVKRRK